MYESTNSAREDVALHPISVNRTVFQPKSCFVDEDKQILMSTSWCKVRSRLNKYLRDNLEVTYQNPRTKSPFAGTSLPRLSLRLSRWDVCQI
jgi:hypothetical protein